MYKCLWRDFDWGNNVCVEFIGGRATGEACMAF